MSDTEVKEVEAVEAETVAEALDTKGDTHLQKCCSCRILPLKNDVEDLGSETSLVPDDERKRSNVSKNLKR